MVPADSRRIPRAPRYSGYRYVSLCFAYGIITLYDVCFQKRLLTRRSTMSRSYNPACALLHLRFGLFPVRSPLLGESLVYFLFLQVLRCFSSLGLPQHCADDRPSDGRVVPFGNPWINGHLHLPKAYRSLSRPSSPPRAKASTRRPNFLSPTSFPTCVGKRCSYFQL